MRGTQRSFSLSCNEEDVVRLDGGAVVAWCQQALLYTTGSWSWHQHSISVLYMTSVHLAGALVSCIYKHRSEFSDGRETDKVFLGPFVFQEVGKKYRTRPV